MSTIGGQLKEAREKKSLTHEEVHAKIKIHPRVLQLMEEDKFEKLPSPLFAKSFLRSYADFLQIDADQVVSNYEKQGRREPEQVLFIRPAESRQKTSDRRWIAPAILLCVVLAGAALIFAAGKAAYERISGLRSQRTQVRTQAPRKAPAVVPVEKDGTWLRSPSQGNYPRINRNAPLQLRIKALDNVWMRVTADGKIVFQSILKRGATESWTAVSSYEIWTGNSSNMSLTLNGAALGSPGKGVVKKMVIDRDGVRNRS
ncbi:MAG: hypothetical protein MOGMAGMI_01063 [Candidatus Omnitrophica bacterium]|nr:hypothetical protein [Candidatus Omnitrophota bacterium]